MLNTLPPEAPNILRSNLAFPSMLMCLSEKLNFKKRFSLTCTLCLSCSRAQIMKMCHPVCKEWCWKDLVWILHTNIGILIENWCVAKEWTIDYIIIITINFRVYVVCHDFLSAKNSQGLLWFFWRNSHRPPPTSNDARETVDIRQGRVVWWYPRPDIERPKNSRGQTVGYGPY